MGAKQLRGILAAAGIIAGLGSMAVLAIELMIGRDNQPASPGMMSGVRPLLDPGGASEQALVAAKAALASRGSAQTQAIVDAEGLLSQLLGLSPMESELWIMRARLAATRTASEQPVAENLKMSYFTAPNDLRLMLPRIDAAVRSAAIADPILETLVQGDIRTVLLRQPELGDQLADSYRTAGEPGKAFLMRTAESIDSRFAARLKTLR